MAITRCPYCRAIVDEKDQYCSNCGTQILFAEDAEAEEEIPGERILNADPEEKDYSIPEPRGDAQAADEEDEDEEEADEDIDDEEEIKDGAEDEEPEEAEEEGKEESEDVIVLEESEAPDNPPTEELAAVIKAGERETRRKPRAETAPEEPPSPSAPPGRRGRRRGPDVIQPVFNFGEAPEARPDTKAVPPEPIEPPGPPEPPEPAGDEPVLPGPEAAEEPEAPAATVSAPEAPPAPAGEAGAEAAAEVPSPGGQSAGEERPPMAVTFDTRELEAIGPTVDLGRQQIEEFLEVLREKEEEGAAVRVPPTGLPPWATGLKETPEREPEPETGPEEEPEAGPDEEEDLGFEGEPLEAEDEGAASGPTPVTPAGRTDSGVGLPERISQSKLPFAREETADEEAAFGARGLGEAEEDEGARRPPFRLSVFLKAKAFDILFIAAVWLVAIWVAARTLGRTIFELFASASTPLLLFGAALLLLYAFPFWFFLGETLGDRLFRDSDEDEGL